MLIDLRPSARLPGAITPEVYLCSSARASARGPQLGGDLPPQDLNAFARRLGRVPRSEEVVGQPGPIRSRARGT